MASQELITTPSDLAAFCKYLASCPVFGFDTEFIGEDSFVPELCLVQVATPERLFVIDPLAVGEMREFWDHVADPAHTVIVHAGREEIRMCQRGCGRLPHNLVDLQIAAGLAGCSYPLGHAPLIQLLLHVRLYKQETLTNWRQRPLSQAQLQYAFDDVRYLLPLWDKLSARLTRLQRLDWLREETDLLLQRSMGQDPGVERWRKLKGIGTLDRHRLAVARALFQWREDRAGQRNRPVRTIVRDDLLIEIARRNPKQEHDLEVLRGLSKREIPEILALVQKAWALPAEEWPAATPRDDDPPQFAWIVSLLHSVLCDMCERMELASTLVASNNDLKLLVRALANGEEPRATLSLARGWRRQAIMPELIALLTGKRSLRIKSLTDASPFELT
jgi:ribonuclease D